MIKRNIKKKKKKIIIIIDKKFKPEDWAEKETENREPEYWKR